MNMATKDFDRNFTHLIEDALHNALEYTGYSLDIDCIYIYISLERSVQYLVFFRINGCLSLKHKLNEYVITKQIDVSDENQRWLNSNGNVITQKIRASFQDDGREVPSSLRITYEPKRGKLNSTMSYDKLLDDEDSLTMYFRWFAEEGGVLEPWQMI
jgi:hypothetical protein